MMSIAVIGMIFCMVLLPILALTQIATLPADGSQKKKTRRAVILSLLAAVVPLILLAAGFSF